MNIQLLNDKGESVMEVNDVLSITQTAKDRITIPINLWSSFEPSSKLCLAVLSYLKQYISTNGFSNLMEVSQMYGNPVESFLINDVEDIDENSDKTAIDFTDNSIAFVFSYIDDNKVNVAMISNIASNMTWFIMFSGMVSVFLQVLDDEYKPAAERIISSIASMIKKDLLSSVKDPEYKPIIRTMLEGFEKLQKDDSEFMKNCIVEKHKNPHELSCSSGQNNIQSFEAVDTFNAKEDFAIKGFLQGNTAIIADNPEVITWARKMALRNGLIIDYSCVEGLYDSLCHYLYVKNNRLYGTDTVSETDADMFINGSDLLDKDDLFIIGEAKKGRTQSI